MSRTSSSPPARVAFGAALCALALFALAGCGGGGASPKASYEKQMKALGARFGNELKAAGKARTAAGGARAFTLLRAQLVTLGHDLARVKTPAKVQNDQAQLIAAVAEFGRELEPVIASLKAGKTSALTTVGSLPGVAKIEKTVVA